MNDFLQNLKFATLVTLVAALLLLLLIWLNRRATELTPVEGNDRFGLAFISSPDALADETRYAGALATGARWNRWPLYWHWVTEGGYSGPHQNGQHDYDALITQDIQHGLTPLIILMGTPAQEATALPETTAPSVDQAGPLKDNPIAISTATLPPRSLYEPIFADGSDTLAPGKTINSANAWAAFVFQTIDRYRPDGILARQQGWSPRQGVRHWEIWNEPDFNAFWNGSPADYGRLLEVAYKSIKTADPQAMVLLGGLAFYEKPGWLAELLRLTEGNSDQVYFDAVSIHHYWSIYGGEARLLETRAALESFGLGNRPIWLTESGLSVWDDFPATAHNVAPDTPWRGTMAEQASYIIQNAALNLFHGVERYYHFMLHDDCGDGPSTAFGLRQNFSPHVCNPAEGRPRPAYAAYSLVAEQFVDIEPLWRKQTYEADQVAFYRPTDRSRLVTLWARQGFTTTITISATHESAQLYWIDPTEASRRVSRVTAVDGVYRLTLPPATNRNAFDRADTTYPIGGRPYLLIEQDTLPPQTKLEKLPADSPPKFIVKWRGEDRGSSIAGYDVWVSRNGGSLQQWLVDTATTQAEFSGSIGQIYGFAVQARDRAGNESPRPTQAEAVTRVISPPLIKGVVLGPGGETVADATVTIEAADRQETVPTNETGQWSIQAFAPGLLSFQATAPDYAAWPAPHVVKATGNSPITLTLAPATNAIQAGDFEGEGVWRVWQWAGQVDLFYQTFDGNWAARLGQGEGEIVACPSGGSGQQWFLRQSITLPSETPTTLAFVYRIETKLTSADDAWFEVNLSIEDKSITLIPLEELGQATGWQFANVDISSWPGHPAVVQFRTVRCTEQPFTVTLDRISLGP